jgi:hypothetical protein
MAGCRDCTRCTESIITSLVLGIPRMIIWFLTFWNFGLFVRRCPRCGHRMGIHQRRADGSFRD